MVVIVIGGFRPAGLSYPISIYFQISSTGLSVIFRSKDLKFHETLSALSETTDNYRKLVYFAEMSRNFAVARNFSEEARRFFRKIWDLRAPRTSVLVRR